MALPLSRAAWESESVERWQTLVGGLPSRSLARVATAALAACMNVIDGPPEVRAVIAIGSDPLDEATAAAAELRDLLAGYKAIYEGAMRAAGLELPYRT